MGLLGGFKAKLKGGEPRKNNKKAPKETEIVCIKYNVFNSEFDSPSTSNVPSTSRAIAERHRANEVARNLSFRHEKVISNGTLPNSSNSNKDQKTEHKDEANSTHLTKDTPTKSPPPKVSEPAKDKGFFSKKPKEEKPKKVDKKPKEPKVAKSKKDKKEKPPPTKTVAKPTPKDKKEREKPRPPIKTETTIEPQPVVVTKENIYEKLPQARHVPEPIVDDNDNDEEGNFKINFANHQSQHDDYSEEEDDDVDLSPSLHGVPGAIFSRVPMSYSSQATSIFFGDDEEPAEARPRNINFDDGGESDGSSASA